MSKGEHLGLTRLNQGDLIVVQAELIKLTNNQSDRNNNETEPEDPKSTTATLFNKGAKKFKEVARGITEKSEEDHVVSKTEEPKEDHVVSIEGKYQNIPITFDVISFENWFVGPITKKFWAIGELPTENAQVYYILGSMSTKEVIAIDADTEPNTDDILADCTDMFISKQAYLAIDSGIRKIFNSKITDPEKRPH